MFIFTIERNICFFLLQNYIFYLMNDECVIWWTNLEMFKCALWIHSNSIIKSLPNWNVFHAIWFLIGTRSVHSNNLCFCSYISGVIALNAALLHQRSGKNTFSIRILLLSIRSFAMWLCVLLEIWNPNRKDKYWPQCGMKLSMPWCSFYSLVHSFVINIFLFLWREPYRYWLISS